MKRTLSLILMLVLLVCSSAWSADVKVSALPATTTLTDDDLFLTSTYLTGVYTSKKITVTSLKTIFQPSLSLLKGTLTNGYICTYTAAGTLLDCNTNPATFQTADTELTALAGLTSAANAIPYFTGSGTAGVISSSADMVYLLGSADYATALTNLGGQPVNDDLTTLSSGGTANCLWGEKSDSSGIECKTSVNIQMDDSAAQFKSATASKGTMKFVQSSIDNGILLTQTPVVTGNATFTNDTVGAGTYKYVFKETDNVFTGANTLGDGGDDQRVVMRLNATNERWSGNTIYFAQCAASMGFGQPAYIQSTGKPGLADADAAATMPAIGLVVVASTDADTPCTVLTHGVITDTDWNWTVGNTIYVADGDAGAVTATLADISDTNDVVQVVGIAVHADSIFVNPSLTTVVLE